MGANFIQPLSFGTGETEMEETKMGRKVILMKGGKIGRDRGKYENHQRLHEQIQIQRN